MKKMILFLSKFFGALTLCLIVIETFLRLTEASLPSRVYDDSKFGRSHLPNANIFEISPEGFCISTVNRYGYLGPTYGLKRNDNSLRVALIGDSYVEGLQLFDRYHFRKVLENELSKMVQKKVEVLNFGIGGIDLRGMYLTHQEKVVNYHPDYVLFFIKKEDLITKDLLPAPELYVEGDSLKVSYGFLQSEEVQLRRKYAFLRKFALGTLLKEAYEYYKMGKTLDVLLEKLNPFSWSIIPQQKQGNSLNTDEDQYIEVNKVIFNRLSKANNPIFNIVVQVDKLPSNYNQLLQSNHLSAFDLNSEMLKQGEAAEKLKWTSGDKVGHWNHLGHRFVGEYLAHQLFYIYKRKSLASTEKDRSK